MILFLIKIQINKLIVLIHVIVFVFITFSTKFTCTFQTCYVRGPPTTSNIYFTYDCEVFTGAKDISPVKVSTGWKKLLTSQSFSQVSKAAFTENGFRPRLKV